MSGALAEALKAGVSGKTEAPAVDAGEQAAIKEAYAELEAAHKAGDYRRIRKAMKLLDDLED